RRAAGNPGREPVGRAADQANCRPDSRCRGTIAGSKPGWGADGREPRTVPRATQPLSHDQQRLSAPNRPDVSLTRLVMRFDLLTRTIVVSALASALVVTVIVATRHTPSVKASDGRDVAPMNPIAAEHRRCKELGLDATSDDACRALWAKDHDQFFG